MKADLTDCCNWAAHDSSYCHAHRNMTPETFKARWVKRFFGHFRYRSWFSYLWNRNVGKRILDDLASKKVVLTREDIEKIPKHQNKIDIFVLLIEYGYAEPNWNVGLYKMAVAYFLLLKVTVPRGATRIATEALMTTLERNLILKDHLALSLFFLCVGSEEWRFAQFVPTLLQYVPTLLDTNAAKQMSWYARDDLDTFRKWYEGRLGPDHPLTQCMVQRWLPDLKELYETEKAVQKLKMDHCKEQLMMFCWHPDRIQKYLDMGYDPDEM